MTRFSISVSDAITAVSHFLHSETIKAFKIERPIHVIHNFVDSDEFRPARDGELRSRFARGDEGLLIHVSNFRKVKNVPTVVEVFCEVRRSHPAKLLLVGEGPELETVERMVAERDLSEHVVFLGDQEFIAGILPAADVFLLPSDHESFGLAALEAMSCGLCVVGSNIGGLHEVVQDGETGFLFDPGDVHGMSDVIVRLLGDSERRREIGRKARARAARDFDREKIVGQYVSLYDGLLEGAQ
jgi:N-acetyl-alpha-D-glucosaminyl L-malate synthase BshA